MKELDKTIFSSITWVIAWLTFFAQLDNLGNTQELVKLLCYSSLLIILVSPLLLNKQFYFTFLNLTEDEPLLSLKVFLFITMIPFSIGTCSYINIKYYGFR